jgi:hypothetical protein
MTTTTPDAMRLRFPEFAAQTDAALGFAIEEAELLIGDGSTWVTQADAQAALMYYAAFVVAVSLQTAESGGTGQVIASESITGLGSVTFGAMPPYDACDLQKNAYGARYLDILKRNQSGGYPI